MTTTEQATVYGLIAEIVNKLGGADPKDVAEQVYDCIPPDLLREFCVDALIPQVAAVIRRRTNETLKNSMNGAPKGKSMPGGTYSGKVKQTAESFASEWEKICSEQVCVNGLWKPIGDCTRDDFNTLAVARRTHAADTIRQAERFERFEALMSRYGPRKLAKNVPADVAIASIRSQS